MKAVVFHEHGDLSVLRYEEVPEPVIGPEEVLIRVRATSVNFLDIWVRRGLPGVNLPHISGADVAGTIERVGERVQGLERGQRVIANPNLSCGKCEYCLAGEDSLCIHYKILGEQTDGGYAELVKVPAKNVIPLPEHVPFEEAAAAPLVFMTAWRALISRAGLRPGEDVLILGAGGGVATAAIQLAKLVGARVFVTASSEEKLEGAKRLGADFLINYKEVEFDKEIRRLTNRRGVDVVLDSIGAETWVKSLGSLAKNGRLVTYGATSGPNPQTEIRLIFWNQLRIIGSTMASTKELHEVLRLLWAGRLKPVIHRVMPLREAAEAQRLLEERKVFGKVVLVP
ncbi:MAG: zinc-binding dehydrogenase [Candidatus Acetothermia bacterium]|jgi:NADPH:quinone reductase-like Zn-dependent oxidoreductase|nr:zinc-binding dehydrogenase [Candidatus Acetothermia bacterium]MDH7505203.1 zinc-binding dehydrogenase [Candidatus Acetothermia bacterium]